MGSQPNPKIIGAFIIGFALVAGAYTYGSFTNIKQPQQAAAVQSTNIAPRVAINVVDNDDNGIEDWRDEFVTTEPIILDRASSTYEDPDTLTGQLGINFMKDIIYARGYGPFGRDDEEVIDDTVDILSKATAHDIFDTPDIHIIKNWTDQDIVNYANGAADAITRNNVAGLEGELNILQDILTLDQTDRVKELDSLAQVYERTRDDTLTLHVPAFLVKEHLDLINTYHAINKDIEAMAMSLEDPAFTLLRLKRYEDDALGLGIALQNAYLAVEPHASLFQEDDPALLFVIFSPNFQI